MLLQPVANMVPPPQNIQPSVTGNYKIWKQQQLDTTGRTINPNSPAARFQQLSQSQLSQSPPTQQQTYATVILPQAQSPVQPPVQPPVQTITSVQPQTTTVNTTTITPVITTDQVPPPVISTPSPVIQTPVSTEDTNKQLRIGIYTLLSFLGGLGLVFIIIGAWKKNYVLLTTGIFFDIISVIFISLIAKGLLLPVPISTFDSIDVIPTCRIYNEGVDHSLSIIKQKNNSMTVINAFNEIEYIN